MEAMEAAAISTRVASKGANPGPSRRASSGQDTKDRRIRWEDLSEDQATTAVWTPVEQGPRVRSSFGERVGEMMR